MGGSLAPRLTGVTPTVSPARRPAACPNSTDRAVRFEETLHAAYPARPPVRPAGAARRGSRLGDAGTGAAQRGSARGLPAADDRGAPGVPADHRGPHRT